MPEADEQVSGLKQASTRGERLKFRVSLEEISMSVSCYFVRFVTLLSILSIYN